MFKIKYTDAFLPNSTRKLLWFEITKMLMAVLKNYFLCVIYYNFRHTLVSFSDAAGNRTAADRSELERIRSRFGT